VPVLDVRLGCPPRARWPRPALATIALKGGSFIAEVKDRKDVQLVAVDPANRDNFPDRLASDLRGRCEGMSKGRGTMQTIDREQVAADWAARGFSCALWVDPPGQRWEGFTHATDELVLLLEGAMEFEVEGRVVRPEVGEELPIPAGARHSARNVGGTTARWLYGYRRG
jgi:mannose-6-phosphate isomerase-like protein (cupin superfamily)